jgi:DNA-binding XRE family transcriptional regulator
MFNNEKVGKRIAALRKDKGLTQEQLAARLDVTGQAVSKWENGAALPDIALLPPLSRLLDTSLDRLLNPFDVFIVEARYCADGLCADVTARVNSLVGPDGLSLPVNQSILGVDPLPGCIKFLWVRYINRDGAWAAFAPQNGLLNLSNEGHGLALQAGGELAVLSAQYGSPEIFRDATAELIKFTHNNRMDHIPVAHEWFPAPAALDGPAHLSILYRSGTSLHTLAVPEGRALVVSEDRRGFYTGVIQPPQPPAAERRIPGVPALGFGKGMDCSFGGAVTAALKAMGESFDYVDVMGFSGCCWRLALSQAGWDPSSVDGLLVYDHAGPLWEGLGFAVSFYDRVTNEERAGVRAAIVAALDQGRPGVAIDLRVAAEWGVICGYREGGRALLCRTYFDGDARDYLEVERWPFLLALFGEKRPRPTPRQILLRSLAMFVEEANIPERRGYWMGYRACQAWSAGLRDETRWAGLPDEGFAGQMEANHFIYLALADARRSAAAYLKRCLEQGLLEGEKGARLSRACEHCAAIATRLEAGWADIPQPQLARLPLREEWPQAKRERQAALLDEIAALERRLQAEFEAILG